MIPKKINIPNSRFIYFKQSENLSSWQGTLGKIDNYIFENSKFEKAGPYALIYFLDDKKFLIGRDVIGALPIIDESGPEILDFTAGEIYSCDIRSGLDLDISSLLNLKKEVCQGNEKLIDPQRPWRLQINLEKEDEIPVKIQFFNQFYPFPKLTN